jgi:acetyl esterase/lipase
MTTDIKIGRDVLYGGGPDGNLTLDLYLPAGAGPHPAVICLHGGAWRGGTKTVYRAWGPWLARAGYAAMAVDYRLSTPDRLTWPGVLDDVRTALAWLTAQAPALGVDAGRIAAMGDSAGAHLSALLALDDAARGRVRAVVGVYGVYDLAEQWTYSGGVRQDNPATALIGGTPPERPEAYAAASPLVYVRRLAEQGARLDTAWFIIWGETDELVSPAQSQTFVATLRDLRVPVETAAVPDYGHFWFTVQEEHPGRDVTEEPNASLAPRLLHFLQAHGSIPSGAASPVP